MSARARLRRAVTWMYSCTYMAVPCVRVRVYMRVPGLIPNPGRARGITAYRESLGAPRTPPNQAAAPVLPILAMGGKHPLLTTMSKRLCLRARGS